MVWYNGVVCCCVSHVVSACHVWSVDGGNTPHQQQNEPKQEEAEVRNTSDPQEAGGTVDR